MRFYQPRASRTRLGSFSELTSPRGVADNPADGELERIVLETAKHRIVGDLTLPREGYRSRLSDFLNRGESHFNPLINVETHSLDGDQPTRRSFIAVARAHVVLAYQHGDDGADQVTVGKGALAADVRSVGAQGRRTIFKASRRS
jgi:hypothetical protein